MSNYKEGNVVKCCVTGIEPYGIFVSLGDYYSGLIHISELSHGFIKNINDMFKIGDVIYAEILDIDHELFQARLSVKNVKINGNDNTGSKKIIETKSGFRTLAYKLPEWIDRENNKNNKNINL